MDSDSFLFPFKAITRLVEDLKHFNEISILVTWIQLLKYIQPNMKKSVENWNRK